MRCCDYWLRQACTQSRQMGHYKIASLFRNHAHSAFIGGTLALTSFVNEFGLDHDSADHFSLLSANIVSTYQVGASQTHFRIRPLSRHISRQAASSGLSVLTQVKRKLSRAFHASPMMFKYSGPLFGEKERSWHVFPAIHRRRRYDARRQFEPWPGSHTRTRVSSANSCRWRASLIEKA
jgi:hypothetical protein